jgi:hypothetical protein
MPQAEGVDPQYRIKAHQVESPDGAQLKASGQRRMLVGVLVLEAILLFVAVSVADALSTLRVERRGQAAAAGAAPDGGVWPPRDDRAERLGELDPDDWPEFDGERSPATNSSSSSRRATEGASPAAERGAAARSRHLAQKPSADSEVGLVPIRS